MNIGTRPIGQGHPTFVVAEISANHCGSLAFAMKLVRAAREAGADAVKFQLYRPEDLTCDSDHPAYVLTDGQWKGRRLWDLYTEAMTPEEWFAPLFEYAASLDIIAFSSVFSTRGLELLESIKCPALKIASAEVVDVELVRACAETGKPVILSDGLATAQQFAMAMQEVPVEQLVVLKCVSEYPAEPDGYNLATIPELQNAGIVAGVSDHTTGVEVPIAATALGASMIEKHLMLEPEVYGAVSGWLGRSGARLLDPNKLPLDHGHSLTPSAFGRMLHAVRNTERALGIARIGQPEATGQWRRRLVFARDLNACTVIGPSHVRAVRCNTGVEADANVVGRVIAGAVLKGEPVYELAFVQPSMAGA